MPEFFPTPRTLRAGPHCQRACFEGTKKPIGQTHCWVQNPNLAVTATDWQSLNRRLTRRRAEPRTADRGSSMSFLTLLQIIFKNPNKHWHYSGSLRPAQREYRCKQEAQNQACRGRFLKTGTRGHEKVENRTRENQTTRLLVEIDIPEWRFRIIRRTAAGYELVQLDNMRDELT